MVTIAKAIKAGQAACRRKDYKTALKLWLPLAKQENSDAQLCLGSMYFLGGGVKQDYTEAMKWVRRAAEQGNAMAEFQLGNYYEHGVGVKKNYREALKWYLKAANRGNRLAQIGLCYLYYKGIGTKRDYAAAYMWGSLAKVKAHDDTPTYRNLAGKQLTSKQIAAIDKRVENWQPIKYYPLFYQLNKKRRYLIWIPSETDGVEVSTQGFIPSFPDIKSLRRYAQTKGYIVEREKPILHNLDRIVLWLKNSNTPVDCKDVLAAWNLFSDIAASFPRRSSAFKKIDKKFPNIYEKMFWGNNLPSVTPKGKSYEPIWSTAELKAIGRLMNCGLDLFAQSTKEWPNAKSAR